MNKCLILLQETTSNRLKLQYDFDSEYIRYTKFHCQGKINSMSMSTCRCVTGNQQNFTLECKNMGLQLQLYYSTKSIGKLHLDMKT